MQVNRAAVGFLLVIMLACGTGRSADGPGAFPDAPEPRGELLQGLFAICAGAYEHFETLILQEGGFEHFIRTHGIYGGRSRGTYELVGDTLVMMVHDVGPAPDGVVEALPLMTDFILGEYAGTPVLWRGREAERQARLHPGTFSVYAALFHAGPDPARPDIPTCAAARDRLAHEGGR